VQKGVGTLYHTKKGVERRTHAFPFPYTPIVIRQLACVPSLTFKLLISEECFSCVEHNSLIVLHVFVNRFCFFDTAECNNVAWLFFEVTYRAGLKGRGAWSIFTGAPYDVIRDVINCQNCVFTYLQSSSLLYPVVENVLAQLHLQLAARSEFMI